MLPTMTAGGSAVLLLVCCAAIMACSLPTEGEDMNNSKYSQIFRDLVFRKDEAHHREARAEQVCDADSKPFTGHCNLDCRCVDGKWKCCRLRKNYENMTQEEIQRYTAAFLTARSDDRYSRTFRSIVWAHSTFACRIVLGRGGLLHTVVPYHRLFIFAMENLLRMVDCRVTLPFYDTSLPIDKLFGDLLFFKDGNFGGNGSGPNMCVQDGPFREGSFTIPKLYHNGKALPSSDCLQRNFSKTRVAYHWKYIQVILTAPPSAATLIESGILSLSDLENHMGIGGSMLGIALGIEPVFYILHSFIDKLVATYQAISPEHKIGGGLWNTTKPLADFPWFQGKDWLDATELPNDVCIRWEASLPTDEAIKMGNYLALEFPRTDHLVHSYEELRDVPLHNTAAEQLRGAVKLFQSDFSTFSFDEHGFHLAKNWSMNTTTFLDRPGSSVTLGCKTDLALFPGFTHYNVTDGVSLLVG